MNKLCLIALGRRLGTLIVLLLPALAMPAGELRAQDAPVAEPISEAQRIRDREGTVIGNMLEQISGKSLEELAAEKELEEALAAEGLSPEEAGTESQGSVMPPDDAGPSDEAVDEAEAASGESAIPAGPFNLFEGVERDNDPWDEEDEPVDEAGEEPAEPAGDGTPAFTLVGISRIGSYYSAIMQEPDGEPFIVELSRSKGESVPGHADYTIADYSSRSVTIGYPESMSCQESFEQGVSCSEDGTQAIIGLANREPLARPRQEDEQAAEEPAEAAEGEGEAGEGLDPEEAEARMRALETLRAALESNSSADLGEAPEFEPFTPLRIAPEDVPVGMRVISTPFGDRLVEQDPQ